MKGLWFFLGALAVALIAIFRKEIGAFFNPGPKEGSACKDTNGAAGTIINGTCIKNTPAEGSACMLNGKPGVIQNGTCVVNEAAERIVVIQAPATLRIAKFFGRVCRRTITTSKYPGITWVLIGSDSRFCYYKRA